MQVGSQLEGDVRMRTLTNGGTPLRLSQVSGHRQGGVEHTSSEHVDSNTTGMVCPEVTLHLPLTHSTINRNDTVHLRCVTANEYLIV